MAVPGPTESGTRPHPWQVNRDAIRGGLCLVLTGLVGTLLSACTAATEGAPRPGSNPGPSDSQPVVRAGARQPFARIQRVFASENRVLARLIDPVDSWPARASLVDLRLRERALLSLVYRAGEHAVYELAEGEPFAAGWLLSASEDTVSAPDVTEPDAPEPEAADPPGNASGGDDLPIPF
ncbi:MAG: hypothetical protein ACFE0O_13550 [Opitutales bacterium]